LLGYRINSVFQRPLQARWENDS